jgi:hypothetical protein
MMCKWNQSSRPLVNVGIYTDFEWNESGLRMDPRCDVGGAKVKHRWNVNGTLVEIRWGYKCKQYFFNR